MKGTLSTSVEASQIFGYRSAAFIFGAAKHNCCLWIASLSLLYLFMIYILANIFHLDLVLYISMPLYAQSDIHGAFVSAGVLLLKPEIWNPYDRNAHSDVRVYCLFHIVPN